MATESKSNKEITASLVQDIFYMDDAMQVFSIANGSNKQMTHIQETCLSKLLLFPGFSQYFKQYFKQKSEFGPTIYQLLSGDSIASVMYFKKALGGNGMYLLFRGKQQFLGFDQSGFPYFDENIIESNRYNEPSEALKDFSRINPLDMALSTLCSLWNNIYRIENKEYSKKIEKAFEDTQKLRKRFRIPLGILLGYYSTADYKIFGIERHSNESHRHKLKSLNELFHHRDTYSPLFDPYFYQEKNSGAEEPILGPIRLKQTGKNKALGLYMDRKPRTSYKTKSLSFLLKEIKYKGSIISPSIEEGDITKRNLSLDHILKEFPTIDSIGLLLPALLQVKYQMFPELESLVNGKQKSVEQIIDESYKENPAATNYALLHLIKEKTGLQFEKKQIPEIINTVTKLFKASEIQSEITQTIILTEQASLLMGQLKEVANLGSTDEVATTTQDLINLRNKEIKKALDEEEMKRRRKQWEPIPHNIPNKYEQ